MTKNTVIIMIIILAGVAGFVFWQNQDGGSEAMIAKAESAAMAARDAMNAADSPEAMMEAVQSTARKDAEALIAKDAMGK